MLVAYAIICHDWQGCGSPYRAEATADVRCLRCADLRGSAKRSQRKSAVPLSLIARPCFGYCSALREVIYDEDQLVIVIAVKDFDVDACLGHPARDLAELTWLSLVQSQDDDVAY